MEPCKSQDDRNLRFPISFFKTTVGFLPQDTGPESISCPHPTAQGGEHQPMCFLTARASVVVVLIGQWPCYCFGKPGLDL